jgi:hypothetical protein
MGKISVPFSGVLIVRKQLFVKLKSSDLRILCAQILIAASIIFGHITTSQKKKYQKENPLRRGIACRREGGKGGAKERRLRRLKEKVTSPFSPSLRSIESAATMENPMGLPQWLGKPLTRFTTLPTPLRAPPFSPPTFSLSERENILRGYPYRGLRLSKHFIPYFGLLL